MALLRRRRPVLRGAIVGGAAYKMGKNKARDESAEDQQKNMQGEKQGAQTAAADTDIQKIKKLQEMHDSGVLTDEEFSKAKANVLAKM